VWGDLLQSEDACAGSLTGKNRFETTLHLKTAGRSSGIWRLEIRSSGLPGETLPGPREVQLEGGSLSTASAKEGGDTPPLLGSNEGGGERATTKRRRYSYTAGFSWPAGEKKSVSEKKRFSLTRRKENATTARNLPQEYVGRKNIGCPYREVQSAGGTLVFGLKTGEVTAGGSNGASSGTKG